MSQLGNRVQHVIRAFTPNDVKALKETVKTFPKSVFYTLEEQFTQLGTGQAFITVLNEKGVPTETVVTHLVPPASFMGPLTSAEYEEHLNASDIYKKYKDAVDPESAFEMLGQRMAEAEEAEAEAKEARNRRRLQRQGHRRDGKNLRLRRLCRRRLQSRWGVKLCAVFSVCCSVVLPAQEPQERPVLNEIACYIE